MKEELFVALLLLALAQIDAVGDALRFRGKQIAHHVLEVIHIAGFVTLWATMPFHVEYIPLYVLGRIVIFDVTFNLMADLPLGYVGKSSLYDIVLTKVGGWVKQHPAHFVFIFRFMALLAWIALIVKA